MACEKASRRLRATLLKASRLGVSTSELAALPSAKRIVSQRDHDWKLAVLLLLMFGGGVIVALVCTTSRGCSKIEDIVSSCLMTLIPRCTDIVDFVRLNFKYCLVVVHQVRKLFWIDR